MNLSLPMQQILLENINKMIESNIFNIPRNDYDKYEKIFLDYGSFAKVNNLGNELRLKIAKILGIFEIRKNWYQNIEKLIDYVKIGLDKTTVVNFKIWWSMYFNKRS